MGWVDICRTTAGRAARATDAAVATRRSDRSIILIGERERAGQLWKRLGCQEASLRDSHRASMRGSEGFF